jgi:hypothetical protein
MNILARIRLILGKETINSVPKMVKKGYKCVEKIH